MTPERVLFSADGIADGGGLDVSPGAALVEYLDPPAAAGGGLRLLAAGSPEEVASRPQASGARRERLEGCVLLPGMVNSHTHLDLTHLGPLDFDEAGGFPRWAETISAGRRKDPEGIRDSVAQGIRLSLAGGVVAVGDISGAMHVEAVEALRQSPLLGVSFLEFFGIGAGQDAAGDRLEALLAARQDLLQPSGVRLGLQPHAPYSVGLRLYERAISISKRIGAPLSTHLSEMIAERQFIAEGQGPVRHLLERLGVWNDAALPEVGRGRTPIEHLAHVLGQAPFLLAHVNDCSDIDLATLVRCGATVAYCPRCSTYFGNDRQFGPHRYRDMLTAGINVALGTDSIVNLPRDQSDRMSVLDEMRFLWNRDATDASTLLAMGTINGARALGLDEAMFRFDRPGAGRPLAGLIAVELVGVGRSRAGRGVEGAPVCEWAMRSSGGVELLVGPGGVR